MTHFALCLALVLAALACAVFVVVVGFAIYIVLKAPGE